MRALNGTFNTTINAGDKTMDGELNCDFAFEICLLRLAIWLGWFLLAWTASTAWIDPNFTDKAQDNEVDGRGR